MSDNRTAEELIEAFNEYAKHRRDKGTATAKLNAWNHLLFKMEKYSNTSQQTASLREELKNLEDELRVEVNLKKTFSMAVDRLQQELELKKERIDREVAYSEKIGAELIQETTKNMKYQTALQRIMDMSLGEDKKRDTIVRMDIHLIAAEALSGKESKPS